MGLTRVWRLVGFAILALVFLAGCRSTTANVTTTAVVAGNAVTGAAVFVDARFACTSCHTFEGISDGNTGPILTTIGADVAVRLTDGSYPGAATDVVSYLREAITDPRAFVAPACPAGPCFDRVMPNNFGELLSPEELADLVAFLAAQG